MRKFTLWVGALLAALAAPAAAQQVATPVTVIASTFSSESVGLDGVAYNTQRDEYLVVWGDRDVQLNEYRLRAIRLDRWGRPIGVPFDVTSSPKDLLQPAVAYDSHNDRYLVVWHDLWAYGGLDWDVRGRFVSGEGVPLDPAPYFIIASSVEQETDPVIASSDSGEKYLVTWTQTALGSMSRDIRGVFVTFDGGIGSPFDLSTHTASPNDRSAVAWDPFFQNFLSVYDRDGALMGRTVGSDGTLGTEMGIGSSWLTGVAACDGILLAVWYQNYNAYGQMVLGAGVFWGSVLTISALTPASDIPASVACRYHGNEFLVLISLETGGWPPTGRALCAKRVNAVTQEQSDLIPLVSVTPFMGFDALTAGGASGWLVVWEDPPYIYSRVLWDLFTDGFEWGTSDRWAYHWP
ncbi:MAG: hypothetical protein BWX64_00681 [Acidobacteria bacterium ADurb.Bin051]|jgi:hypothetical protein|nr:MAG: hypothetical protein BWX64_00681 [Acidobacteria bacterium ADurb.Bin051]